MEQWIVNVLNTLAKLPQATVCRHYIALSILDELLRAHPELNGENVSALIKAFADNSEGDETAQELLQKICQNSS